MTTIIVNQNIRDLVKYYIHSKSNLPADLRDVPIGDWDVSRVTNMVGLFQNKSTFNESLENWNVSNVTAMNSMFSGATNFNQPLEKWNVSNVKIMDYLFKGATNFNQPLNNWNVSNVVYMSSMFEEATNFNQPLDKWNTYIVTYMGSMFNEATNFNQPLDKWNTSNVINMQFMFRKAKSFNQSLNDWDVSKVQNMEGMFKEAINFNQPLNNWNVSNVDNMSFMFTAAVKFNQNLNDWDVRRVDTNSYMFSGATMFNQPLNNWKLERVRSLNGMFSDASSFNQPLNDWNVTNVFNMRRMFYAATQFNQPLDRWNVSNVQYMEKMFIGANNFDQSLKNWKVQPSINVDEMFNPTFDPNKKPEMLVTSYMDFYNPDKPDAAFDKFNEMMQPFKDKEITMLNTHKYIGDSILHGQTNPYLVHYETFEGRSYPIITILKGTVLFTARKYIPSSLNESYFHLYKLYNNPSLSLYENGNFENSLTYFYPVPFMASVIDTQFKRMDMVVLKKDIRLLCMISPSPIDRGIKGYHEKAAVINPVNKKQYYGNADIRICHNRQYDLCLSKELIYALRLNGYIGIAHMDSLSIPENIEKLRHLFVKYEDYTSSALYLSSCFDNTIHNKRYGALGGRFIDKMIDQRTYGIPEVVLIPYDIHDYNNPIIYQNTYYDFSSRLTSDRINDINFIFRHELHVDGENTVEIARKIAYELGVISDKLGKSLQCFPLLNVLNDEVEPEQADYVIDYISGKNRLTLNDVAFTNSYATPSTSKSAFETVFFYEKLESSVTRGGRSLITKSNKIIQSNPYVLQKTPPQKLQGQNKKPIMAKNLISDNAYYSEVNGIPIFAWIHNKSEKKTGGKIKKTRKQTTKKMKKRNAKRNSKRNTKRRLKRL